VGASCDSTECVLSLSYLHQLLLTEGVRAGRFSLEDVLIRDEAGVVQC